MKKVLLLLFLSITLPALSQSKPFQVDLGLNQSWFLYDTEFKELNEYKSEFKPQLALGVSYNFDLEGDFIASTGIRYYNLGREIKVDFGSGEKVVSINHYLLSLPLQLKYEISVLNINVLLNAEPSFIITSNSKGISDNRGITSEMNRFQFLIGAGLEYHFNIGQQSFGIKSIFNLGLTTVPKDEIFRDSENREFHYISYRAKEVNVSLFYNF